MKKFRWRDAANAVNQVHVIFCQTQLDVEREFLLATRKKNIHTFVTSSYLIAL